MFAAASGTFGRPVLTPATTAIRSIGTADFNGDGIPDVIVVQAVDSIDQEIVGYVGRGDGRFDIVSTHVIDNGIRSDIQAGDLGTGKTDILYRGPSPSGIVCIPSL